MTPPGPPAPPPTPRPKVTTGAWVVAAFSFFPFLGLLPGFGLLLWALLSRAPGARRVALVAGIGMLMTVLAIGAYAFMFHAMARDSLRDTVALVETYRVLHGRYPEELKQVREGKIASFTGFWDPMQMFNDGPSELFYQRVGAGYYLLGRGWDGLPFTADDLLPEMDESLRARTGLRIHPDSRGHPEG